MEDRTVTLKNGAVEFGPLVSGMRIILQDLVRNEPIPFYELVMVARNPQHQVFSERISERLKSLNLLEGDGRMHESVRNVIRSAVTGEDLGMELGSPYAES